MITLHHVQVSCPPGGEDEARRFYADGLGLPEVEKPIALRARGGCWFRASGVELHVGVEEEFRPAGKAHPAFLVDDLSVVSSRLRKLGFVVDESERETFEGCLRFHTRDAAGNRVEVLQQV